jgi:undecaprenyl diphosphate synthase|tara:strand:- start:654 stop:1385 length:732 start_codon:yes stop_codon:yes gene_type:complete
MMDQQKTIPAHIAIIMDGNGRWAKARGLPRVAGHRQGAEAVRRAVKAAASLGVRYLTLFSFSSENWQRPASEVGDLMGLLRRYLSSEIAELHRSNVRLRVIGDRRRLSNDIVKMIEDGESRTADNDKMTLIIALSYGARQEIVDAAQRLAEAVQRGEMAPEEITEQTFAARLYTADVPDPDLLIRTSGEQRISNFLLWQLAYAELYFSEGYWPDFDREELCRAIDNFQRRERRFGAAVSSMGS